MSGPGDTVSSGTIGGSSDSSLLEVSGINVFSIYTPACSRDAIGSPMINKGSNGHIRSASRPPSSIASVEIPAAASMPRRIVAPIQREIKLSIAD